MKLITLGLCLASLTAGLALSAAAVQDKKPQDPKAGGGKPADQAMPEVKPGPEHALLAKDAGTWDATVTDMMSEKPSVTKGTEVRRMVGGLWLVSDHTGEMGKMPFYGHGVSGYDQTKKKYVGVWVDTMGSALNLTEGTYDAATKKMTCTMTGEMGTATLVTEYKDDNTQVFTMSGPGGDGKPITMLTIEYKRRK